VHQVDFITYIYRDTRLTKPTILLCCSIEYNWPTLCTDYHSFIWYADFYMFRHPYANFRELLMSIWVTWMQKWLCCLSCTVNVGGLCALVVVVSCVLFVQLSAYSVCAQEYALSCQDCEFVSLEIVACYRVEVCEPGWSLVQRSPTEWDVSELDREASAMRRPWTKRECSRTTKQNHFRRFTERNIF
jgi:hypothetical protein